MVNTFSQKSFATKQKISTLIPKIQYLVDIGISKETLTSVFDKTYDSLFRVGIKRIPNIISLFLSNYI